jgi:hypothetical protein
MITVRFASGFSVQYNSANYVYTTAHPAGGGYHDLYVDSEKSNWIARVPIDALVEVTRPCRTYDAKHAPDELAKAALLAIANREFNSSDLAKMKRALRGFNALRRIWK